jgi:gamma-glutamyltranspeptidase/glutathione hydrolase
MHVENDWLHLEPGAWPGGPITVPGEFGNLREWPDQNLYFGGVHAVWRDSAGFQAAGDPRRGGAALVLE